MAMVALRSNKFLLLAAALLLIGAFFLALFHCHEHDEHHAQECSICRLTKQLTVILGFVALLLGVTRPRTYSLLFSEQKPAFVPLPVRSGRAPPFSF